MKKLATITKIGQAALTRIFKPHSTFNAMEQSVTSVYFPKEDYDLEAELKANRHSSHEFNIQSNSSRSYQVWGIEIGCPFLKVLEGDTALDAIARLIEGKFSETPSHFIVREWSSNDVSGDNEAYTIYRLSQKQEVDVKRYVNDRMYIFEHVTVEPMPSYANHRVGHNFGSKIAHQSGTVTRELNGSGITEEEAKEDVIRQWCKIVK